MSTVLNSNYAFSPRRYVHEHSGSEYHEFDDRSHFFRPHDVKVVVEHLAEKLAGEADGVDGGEAAENAAEDAAEGKKG